MGAGHTMEGTRLTIVRVPKQPEAYEFSIRTPVTPPRWKDFDQVGPPCLSHVLLHVDHDLSSHYTHTTSGCFCPRASRYDAVDFSH